MTEENKSNSQRHWKLKYWQVGTKIQIPWFPKHEKHETLSNMYQTKKMVSLDCNDNDHISRLLPTGRAYWNPGPFWVSDSTSEDVPHGCLLPPCPSWCMPDLVPKKGDLKGGVASPFCVSFYNMYIYISYIWRWRVMLDVICAKTKIWDRMVDGLNAKRRNQEIKSWDDDISHASWDLMSIEFSAVECTNNYKPISCFFSWRNSYAVRISRETSFFWKN